MLKRFLLLLLLPLLLVDPTDAATSTLPVSGLTSASEVLSAGTKVVGKVNTIAALRLLSGKAAGQTVSVLGYYAAGDGGGGPVRYWVSGAAPGTYTDNGGSIIVPTGGDGSAAWLWEWSAATPLHWWGAKHDNSTDDTNTYTTAAAAASKSVIVGAGTHKVTETAITDPVRIYGTSPTSAITNPAQNKRTVFVTDDGATRTTDSVVSGVLASNHVGNTDDDHSAIQYFGVDRSKIVGNAVTAATDGISIQYGAITLGAYVGTANSNTPELQPLRQSNANAVALNTVNTTGIGYESFANRLTTYVGNVAQASAPATSHAYRLTGYPGMPAEGNSFVGNTGENYVNGISIQTAAFGNNMSGFAFKNLTGQAIQQTINTSYADYHSSHNYVQAVAATMADGIYAYNPNWNYYSLLAKDVNGTYGVYLKKDAGSNGAARGNLVDAIVTDAPQGARIETDYGVYRLVLDTLTQNATTIAGSGNIIDVVVYGVASGTAKISLSVTGNNNIIRCVSAANTSPATADLSISGADNVVTMHVATGVSISGARNTVEGTLGNVVSLAGATDTKLRGTATSITRGGTNSDYSGVRGGGGAGVVTATTDGSGELSATVTGVPAGLTVWSVVGTYLHATNNDRGVVLKSASMAAGTLTMVFRIIDTNAGTAAAGESATVHYRYTAI